MKGRKKLFSFVALLSVLLITPLVFSFGLVDVSKFSFGGSLESSSTPTIFVDPDKIIKDYLLDPGYQIGDTFQVHVNITGVTDLFTWNVNITWNPAILNFSRVKEYGPFLRATTSPNGTSGWIDRDPTKNVTVAPFNNTVGYVGIAETILGEYLGITGDGRLVTIEFLIVGYGWTDLSISVGGTLPTVLLNSTGETITHARTGGFFKNTILSDIRGPGAPDYPPDGVVDGWDYGFIGLAFGKSSGDPDWDDYKIADTRGPGAPDYLPDGVVDGWDYGYCGLQFGESI